MLNEKFIYSFTKSHLGLFILCISLLVGIIFHHGWANYDQDNTLEYTGVILSNDIGNPHTYIDFEVIDEDNMVWEVVLAPLSRMRNRGFSNDSMLSVGDTITVVGYQHRTIENEMRAERIIIGELTIELR
jgi:hypothetical protein